MTEFLRQRLSIAVQKGNAAAVLRRLSQEAAFASKRTSQPWTISNWTILWLGLLFNRVPHSASIFILRTALFTSICVLCAFLAFSILFRIFVLKWMWPKIQKILEPPLGIITWLLGLLTELFERLIYKTWMIHYLLTLFQLKLSSAVHQF